MHEYSLVEAMMEKVEQEAQARKALAVNRVQVRLGRLSEVEEGVFATAFEAMRTGTICEDAELVLLREEGSWRCAACGHVLPPEGALTCPKCEWPVHHVAGGELVLERIDMEFPGS